MGILRTDKISGLETPTAVTGSVVFDGSGDYLQITPDEDFAFGNSDFTIETWAYFDTVSASSGQIYEGRPSGTQGAYVSLYFSADNTFSFYTDSAVKISGTVIASRWYHIALVRNSGTTTLYLDGISQGTYSDSQSYLVRTDGPIIGVSRSGSGNPLDGYLSNYRILKGTALYTSDFTPPTHALEVIGDTILLCCNNSDSAGADGTGKTVTANGNAAASTFSPGLIKDFTFGTEFNGVTTFDTQGYFVPPSGTTTQRGRGHAVFGGGENPSNVNVIYSINISSSGTAENFGDLTIARKELGGCASSTRGVFAGGSSTGESPAPPFSRSNVIDYVTLATEGNAADFGDLTGLHDMMHCGLSNSTRGIFAGGEMPSAPSGTNTIQYVTIAALGNAQDFGDLLRNTRESTGCASPTRGIIFGDGLGEIQYITISTLGNAIDFGDHNTNDLAASCSDSTRGIIGGGTNLNPGATTNTIDYVTIATTGDAQDFGDLIVARKELAAVSNSIRGVFGGGHESGNTIDYIIIQTTGNAQDFGDLPISGNSQEQGSCSDSHGGIS
jgi:hypothetical protein